jgi:hypothetical protein
LGQVAAARAKAAAEIQLRKESSPDVAKDLAQLIGTTEPSPSPAVETAIAPEPPKGGI